LADEKKELAVFLQLNESVCSHCGAALAAHACITMAHTGSVCLTCSDMDHLLFLPAGDMALTLRSKKYSGLWAVVWRWNRRRKRYERQGLLVEEAALDQAERECLADEDLRSRRREREAARRLVQDERYIEQFAAAVRAQYPHCPERVENTIAQHACCKYSGRVGRAAFAKAFSAKAIELAVCAHIRHVETDYDDLLVRGVERAAAREQVWDKVCRVLRVWQGPGPDKRARDDSAFLQQHDDL
jgi:hypothetical protein